MHLDGNEPAMQTALSAEIAQLRADLEQMRSERDRLAEMQTRVMELLRVQSPDRLIHDLRNMLNELVLLKSLVEME